MEIEINENVTSTFSIADFPVKLRYEIKHVANVQHRTMKHLVIEAMTMYLDEISEVDK